MQISLTINCGLQDFAALAAMLQTASQFGVNIAPSAAPVIAAPVAPPMPVATAPAAPVAPPMPVTDMQPAPAAPVAPPMPVTDMQPAPAAPVAFDAAGMPWDERIHSGAKSLNGDGTWRKRKGIDPAVAQFVENELRQLGRTMPVATAPAAPVAPPMPVATAPAAPVATAPAAPVAPPMPVATAPAAPVAPPMPVIAAPVAPPMPVIAAPVAGAMNFPTLMVEISRLMSENRLTVTDTANLCVMLTQRLGRTINSLTDIVADAPAVQVLAQIMRERQLIA